MATIGERGIRGLQMAVDDLNAKGGLLGSKIEIVQADNSGSPATANTVTRAMIQNDGIKALFGSSTSATAAAEEALAGQAKLPMMIFAGNDISLTTTNFNAYSFQLQPSTYMEPRAVAQYLAKSKPARHLHHLARLQLRPLLCLELHGRAEGERRGGDAGREQYPPLASTDYTSYISAALAAKPDFVFVGLFAGDLVTFIRQAKGYGLFAKLKVGVSTATDIAESLKAETPAGATMWARATFFAIGTPAINEFADRHFKRFGEWPSDWPVLGYSAVEIWAEAVRRAGSFDGTKVAAALSGGTFDTHPREAHVAYLRPPGGRARLPRRRRGAGRSALRLPHPRTAYRRGADQDHDVVRRRRRAATEVTAALGKEGKGLCPLTPLRAEPLEPATFERSEQQGAEVRVATSPSPPAAQTA